MKDKLLKSIENEKAVLSNSLKSKEACQETIELIDEFDFSDVNLSTLFINIKKAFTQTGFADYNIVKSYISDNMELVSIADELINYKSDINSNEQYCIIVRNKTRLRNILNFSQDIKEKVLSGEYDIDEIIQKAEEAIYSNSKIGYAKNMLSADTCVNKFIERLEHSMEFGQRVEGLVTGIDKLDYITMGFKPPQYIIIAGRPSMGKTELALQIIAENTYKNKELGVMFSLEMSSRDVMRRLVSNITEIPLYKLKTGYLTQTEKEKVYSMTDSIKQMPLMIDETPGISIHELTSKTRRLKMKHPELKYIVVDHFEYVSLKEKRSINLQEELTIISRYFKNLAKQLDICVILLSQLNRECEKREDKRPVLSDFRNTGCLEQDGDIVLMLYNDFYYNKNTPEPNKCEISIPKNRDGEQSMVYANNNKEIQRFYNWEE